MFDIKPPYANAKKILTKLPIISSFIVITCATTTLNPNKALADLSPSKRPFAYSVEFTNPPTLLPRTKQGEQGVINRLANQADIVILGSHDNSLKDVLLEVNIFILFSVFYYY